VSGFVAAALVGRPATPMQAISAKPMNVIGLIPG
jgi:hypothetical protein